jgi:hypothetical protein
LLEELLRVTDVDRRLLLLLLIAEERLPEEFKMRVPIVLEEDRLLIELPVCLKNRFTRLKKIGRSF